jgi:hypothetical protein
MQSLTERLPQGIVLSSLGFKSISFALKVIQLGQ